jgi:hypothetical protein
MAFMLGLIRRKQQCCMSVLIVPQTKRLEYVVNAELISLCHSICLDVSFQKLYRFLRGYGAL